MYGACGGEAVTNIGSKLVQYNTENHKIRNIEFEIGDNIAKPLIAVSDETARGNAVFFGPGPKFESMIIHDPDAFCCFKGPITYIKLRNGTYEIDIREQYRSEIGNIDGSSDSNADEGPGAQAVEVVPGSAN